MTTSTAVANVSLQIKLRRDCKELEYGVGWVWSRVWSIYWVWSSLKLREGARMDMNQELAVSGIGCSYTNTSIYPLVLMLKEGWGSRAMCFHQGCPASVTSCSILSWRLGTPSPGALGRGVCSRALCCCFLSEQLPDTTVEIHDWYYKAKVCPLLRSCLLEGWCLSLAFSCSAHHWGGRKGHRKMQLQA